MFVENFPLPPPSLSLIFLCNFFQFLNNQTKNKLQIHYFDFIFLIAKQREKYVGFLSSPFIFSITKQRYIPDCKGLSAMSSSYQEGFRKGKWGRVTWCRGEVIKEKQKRKVERGIGAQGEVREKKRKETWVRVTGREGGEKHRNESGLDLGRELKTEGKKKYSTSICEIPL